MDILAKIGVCLTAIIFYVLIFWGLAAPSFLVKGKRKEYFLFVLVAHLVVAIIGWGSWGMEFLLRS